MRLISILTLLPLALSVQVPFGVSPSDTPSPTLQQQVTFPPSSSLLSHTSHTELSTSTSLNPRPLVIWHGLGDTALSEGIRYFIDEVKKIYPGIFVHSVQVPVGGTPQEEQRAGFYGNGTAQVDQAAANLSSIPELAGGFDGMGFSQGGLFFRDYVQRYNDPPVKNLITFGTPHLGIAKALVCPARAYTCIVASRAVEARAYTKWAQGNLIQAGYYRDVERLDEFLEVNEFLTRLNGETEAQPLAQRNLPSLTNLVLIQFTNDTTVYPASSSHFGSLTSKSSDPDGVQFEIPMEKHDFLWKEDRIGLRTLSEKGGLVFEDCPGQHMVLGEIGDPEGCARRMVDRYIGWAA